MTHAEPALTGSCSRCGSCCTFGDLRCGYLRVDPSKRIGDPGATHCGAYTVRYDGMPITLVDTQGNPVIPSTCLKGGILETLAVGRWIGAGCSMRVGYRVYRESSKESSAASMWGQASHSNGQDTNGEDPQ